MIILGKVINLVKMLIYLVQKIAIQSKVVVTVFANPYSLNSFLFVNNFDAIVLSYQNSEISQDMSARKLFLEEYQ